MVYEFLADGFEEIEALATVDILRRADIEVKTVSVTGKKEVAGAHGITVLADILFEEMDEKANLLILPGGMPGTLNLQAHTPLCDMLVKAAADKTYIAAICAAPSVFGGLGLLKGRNAICYPGFEGELRDAVISEKAGVVTDGNITTAKGMGVAFEFGIELVRALYGEEKAKAVSDATMRPYAALTEIYK